MLPLVQANPPLQPLTAPAYQRLQQAVRPFQRWADRLPDHYDVVVHQDDKELAVILAPNTFPETLVLEHVPRVAGDLWPHLVRSPLFPHPDLIEYFMGDEGFWLETTHELYEEQNGREPSNDLELYTWAREQGLASPNMVLETFDWTRPESERPLEALLDIPGYPGRIARALWLLTKALDAAPSASTEPYEEACEVPPYLIFTPSHPPALKPTAGVEAILDAIEAHAQHVEIIYDAYLLPAQPEPIYRTIRLWWLSHRLFQLLSEWEVYLAQTQEDQNPTRPPA